MEKFEKVTEKELLNKIFKFYTNPEETGALVIPSILKGCRWYITKIKNGMLEFMKDQPLLDRIRKERGLDWEDLEKSYLDGKSKREEEIGTALRFFPASIDSHDPLLYKHNIQPHEINDIDYLPEFFAKILLERFGTMLYSGPFVREESIDSLICYVAKITEQELEGDISKFREGNNEYQVEVDDLIVEDLVWLLKNNKQKIS